MIATLLTLRRNILTIIRAALIHDVNVAALKVRILKSRHNLQHKRIMAQSESSPSISAAIYDSKTKTNKAAIENALKL
jgi:hypothetical protein